MAEFATTTLFQLTHFINHCHGDIANGWSESWYLFDQDRTSALATAAELLEARSWLIAAEHVIEWAEIKYMQTPHNVQAAIGDPIGPLAVWGGSDNDAVRLMFRFDTDRGKFSNHWIGAVADTEIKNNRWIRWPMTLPAGIAPKPANPNTATKDQLWKYFLTLFRAKTCHAELVSAGEPGEDVWLLRSYEDVPRAVVTTRRYGSAYFRVSAEWAEYATAADYSYCGTVFGVQRTCRVVDVYAYKNGPKIALRLYYAGFDAAVFPHPTIFFGIYRDKENKNYAAPGEITGPQRTPTKPTGTWEYSLGYSFGAAPGIAPTGPPSRFLGQDLIPFNPFPVTPPEFLPSCDMNVFSFTVGDIDPVNTVVSNAMKMNFKAQFYDVAATGTHEVTIGLKSLEERGDLPAVLAAIAMRT